MSIRRSGLSRDRRANERYTLICEEPENLLRAARLLTRDAQDAEDLLQDTFERLGRNWARVRKADNLNAYVHRVMVNIFLDSVRRPRGGRQVQMETLDLDPTSPTHERADQIDSVADMLVVRTGLEELSPRHRTAIVLRYYVQMSTSEIAETMGIRPSSARSLLSRATTELARHLPDWSEES